MAQRTRIEVKIKISCRKDYDEQTIMDRDITCDVPPGWDPVEYLNSVVRRETEIIGTASKAFPQLQALPAPVEEDA